MTRILLSSVAFLFLLACSWSLSDESGFFPLFDGKTLDGWDAKPGAWEVRNGEIWCTGKSEQKNWLIWRGGEPADFVLRLEMRWESGNSGVQVRSDDLGGWQIFGYQVELAKRDVMGLWHHSLLSKDSPKKEARHLMAVAGEKVLLSESGEKTVESVGSGEELKATFREREWNTLEIVAKGDTLTQTINGKVFSIVVDRDVEMSRKKGFLALQDHGKGCVVGFRQIELKILD